MCSRNRCHLIGPRPRQSPSRSRRGAGLLGFSTIPRDRATAAAQASSTTAASRSRHRRTAAAAAAAASSRRKLASACHRHARHAAERPCARQQQSWRQRPRGQETDQHDDDWQQHCGRTLARAHGIERQPAMLLSYRAADRSRAAPRGVSALSRLHVVLSRCLPWPATW